MACHINTPSWRLAIAGSAGTRLASLAGLQRNPRSRRIELRKKAHARSSWEITEETLRSQREVEAVRAGQDDISLDDV